MSTSNRSQLALFGLPVIDNLDDLSCALRVSSGLLHRLSSEPSLFYRFYTVKKRSGGLREISQPNRTCKAVQAWILGNILGRMRVSPACKGFEKGTNIRANALPHARANALLCLDIEDFFPSISGGRVQKIFARAGYSARIASLLAALCTVRQRLPQGAPTSPKLANLACWRLDARLLGYVGRRGIVYTRYADDLAFSAARTPMLVDASHMIRAIVHDEGFRFNPRKTRLAGPARCRRITGLVLGESGVGIGRKRYRKLRAELHSLSHCDQGESALPMVHSLQGWLAFVEDVDPQRFKVLSQYVQRLQDECPDAAVSLIRLPPSW
jgi:RNA-directed DNA polymerase